MVAVSQVNGRRIEDGHALVPIATIDRGIWNSAGLVSRACAGREVFTQRLVDETIKHLKRFADEYAKRSNHFDVVRGWITGLHLRSDRQSSADSPILWGVDLAAMANVICRPILLLDADAPYTTNVFLPFLCQPDDCRDRDGRKRSPLMLAWSDDVRSSRVAMVSMAGSIGIAPVWLPREWFKPVWSVPDAKTAEAMLDQYLDFDRNRCLVAHGKYFRVKIFSPIFFVLFYLCSSVLA